MSTATVPRPATEAAMPVVGSPGTSSPHPAATPPTPGSAAPGGSTTPPAADPDPAPNGQAPRGGQTTGGQTPFDSQSPPAAGPGVPGPAAELVPAPDVPSLLDPALCLAADVLDDIERVRIANENRLRQLTRTATDADGQERGFGLDPGHPDVARLKVMVETLAKVEHDATLELQRKLRKHPLGAWVKAQRGVGEKQGARLLAAIGDPYVNSATGQPRTVSALWAYCGLHVLPAGVQVDAGAHVVSDAGREPDPPPASVIAMPERAALAEARHGGPGQGAGDARTPTAGVAAKRRKGERANWSTKAKTRAYLIAESCVKQLSPDCRDGHLSIGAHDEHAVPAPAGGRETGQGRLDARHAFACPCSPYRVTYDNRRAHTATTHPGWTDGHSHQDALRVASKAVLKDLWRAARDWHAANGDV